MRLRGADGWFDAGSLPSDGCCPPSLDRLEICSLKRSMVNLLPYGPLWDRGKAEVIGACDPAKAYVDPDCGVDCAPCDDSCTAPLARYASYLGVLMYDLLMDNLRITLRESSPNTAVRTVGDWLERFGWHNCFETLCRSRRMALLSPFVIGGDGCSSAYCPPATPEELARAVEQATLRSLRRLQIRPRRNLAGINWVIEPLGAVLTVNANAPCPDSYDATANTTERDCCPPPQFCMSPIGDGSLTYTVEDGSQITVQGWFLQDCNIGPKVWPGLLAAHCIALSMIPEDKCDDTIPIRWCDC